ncbi:MAG: hypothetical protein IPP19_15425 [Verrucomicrobia bacterium]|nr:hypothetical protein [Verrucomicrobiota bacterium]
MIANAHHRFRRCRHRARNFAEHASLQQHDSPRELRHAIEYRFARDHWREHPQ